MKNIPPFTRQIAKLNCDGVVFRQSAYTVAPVAPLVR